MPTTDSELTLARAAAAPKQQGLIKLDIYHLFWIFVICSVVGLIIEIIFNYVAFRDLRSRYGLAWGPFSPIYGCGAVLFTVTLNHLWNRGIMRVFLTAMALGCTLEYLTGVILQGAFGIIAWDYSGSPLSIGGKTSIVYGLIWGLLGVVWIRFFLPLLNGLLEWVAPGIRPSMTAISLLLISFDIAVTVTVLDRQFQRACDVPAHSAIARACDTFFPDEWCNQRFENMSMNTERAMR
jgi:uncharacterized membrane protein